MKKPGKTIFIILAVFLLAASPVFSQNIEDIKKAADIVIDDLGAAIPFNSTLGLNWSDAYIGQIPQFGIGASVGITTIDFTAASDLLSLFGTDIPFKDSDFFKGIGLPVPAYTAEARIGGIIIPIDVGLKFGILKPDFSKDLLDKFTSDSGFGLDYLLIGGDVRYALINKKVFPLRLSIGLGVNYLRGGISSAFTQTINLTGGSIPFTDSTMEVLWNTLNFELKAQVSFPFAIITPYLGAGASYSISEAGFKVTGDITNAAHINQLKTLGMTDASAEGFEYIKEINSFNVRAFGGFSINLSVIRLDFTGMFNVLNGNFGASFGIRFQN